MDQVPKKLYKSRRDRMIDGVCGGIAEYLDVDSTIVRILWVIVTLMGGAGILLYIAAMIIVPVNPAHVASPPRPPTAKRHPPKKKAEALPAPTPTGGPAPEAGVSSADSTRKFWGALLVIVGVLILVSNLNLFHWYWIHWWDLSWSFALPVILILAGFALIYYTYSRGRASGRAESAEAEGTQSAQAEAAKALRRSRTDKKIFGVCGGLANYLNIDSSVVRILFVILTLASFGIGILLYLVLALFMPQET